MAPEEALGSPNLSCPPLASEQAGLQLPERAASHQLEPTTQQAQPKTLTGISQDDMDEADLLDNRVSDQHRKLRPLEHGLETPGQ
eukprot:10404145-Prorocentrum_lima.AAC.1